MNRLKKDVLFGKLVRKMKKTILAARLKFAKLQLNGPRVFWNNVYFR